VTLRSGTVGSPLEQAAVPPAPYRLRFSVDDLRLVRQVTGHWAARAGLAQERAADFVLAVNEVATNAVRHGSPEGWLQLRVTGPDMAVAKVRDSGHWQLDPGPGPRPGWACHWRGWSVTRSSSGPAAAAPW
jgi:serine/threonine-protein kinase RsbW